MRPLTTSVLVPPRYCHSPVTLMRTMSFLPIIPSGAAAAAPDGMIGKNDIVLIKVNGEWQYRGGTNTDVVKGLINAIVHHPDGFTGEIVIVENGQWASFMDNRPDKQNLSLIHISEPTRLGM